jgi:hypothetical protein
MFEKRHHKILNTQQFAVRVMVWLVATGVVLCASLAVGVMGYHFLEGMAWLDAFLNAAMILGGMGPVDALHTAAGKVFAGLYALYCGLLLVVCGGVLLVPVFHRVLHRFHADVS